MQGRRGSRYPDRKYFDVDAKALPALRNPLSQQ